MKGPLYALALSLLLSWAAPAPAADEFVVPEQAIVGAEKPVPLGELVDLSVSPVKEKPPHHVKTTYAWKVLDGGREKHVKEYGGGVFFGAGIRPRRLTAVVAVTHLYEVKEADKVTRADARTVLLTAEVVIGDTPAPDHPDGGPAFPDGRYKLAAFAYRAAGEKIGLPADRRARAAAAMAAAFRGVAGSIADGTLRDPEDILKKSKAANAEALKGAGIDAAKVKPFSEALAARLYGLYKDRQLSTADDYRAAYLEIAQGLEKVR